MNSTIIQDCIENNVELTLTLKANDLLEFGQFILDKASQEAEEQKRKKDNEIYYSVDEAMEVLNLKTRVTLWRWDKSGYLPANKVGKLIRYKKSDIEKLLNGEPYK